MEQIRVWGDRLLASLQEASQTIISYVPSLLVAVAVVLVGWLVARLLRYMTIRAIERVDWLFGHGTAAAQGEKSASGQTLTKAVGTVVFWTVFLSFLAAALRNLDFDVIDQWTASVLSYLPALVGSVMIILLAIAAGSLIRQVVEPAAESIGALNGELVGRLSQIAIVITGVIIGTGVLGIDVTFVIQLTTVVVGVALAGVALAFALGIREHLANLVGIRYARKRYKSGERVRIGKYEGHIIEIADGFLFLETTDGDVSIPGRYISIEPFTKLVNHNTDGR